MRTEKSFAFLRAKDAPLTTQVSMSLLGTAEKIDGADNLVILGWAKELGLDGVYRHTSTPWCGLARAYVIHRRNLLLPPEYRVAIPKDPLWALNWRSFGIGVDRPVLGDTMVKARDGGGHVTEYAGETETHYLCLGGNQSDREDFAMYRKDLAWSFRRIPYRVMPATATPVFLDIPNLADRLSGRREN